MSRPLLVFSVALSLLGGGVGGWMLHELKLRQLAAVPDAEEWQRPLLVIPGLTSPVYLPLPPVKDEPAAPTPILPSGATAESHPPDPLMNRITTDLLFALKDGTMSGEFQGNGRDRIRLMMVNRAQQPIRLSIPAGQTFQGMHGSVVVARAAAFDFAPGESRLEEVATLAISSMNRVEAAAFMPTEDRHERMEPLLRHLSAHPEIAIPTAQTAALAILENLPASSVAKFAPAEGEVPQPWDTAAFRVETPDLIAALALLRHLGLPDSQVVMSIDPQTRIESMLDPLSRAQAMHYYGITPEREWAYWRSELLEGNPRTRHYALHGIGRYFPEVALKMLPDWVREKRTTHAFRTTAVVALTETRRPEALDLLKALQAELVDDTDLSLAIAEAATFLETSLVAVERRINRRVDFRAEVVSAPPVPLRPEAEVKLEALLEEIFAEADESDLVLELAGMEAGEEEDLAEGDEASEAEAPQPELLEQKEPGGDFAEGGL